MIESPSYAEISPSVPSFCPTSWPQDSQWCNDPSPFRAHTSPKTHPGTLISIRTNLQHIPRPMARIARRSTTRHRLCRRAMLSKESSHLQLCTATTHARSTRGMSLDFTSTRSLSMVLARRSSGQGLRFQELLASSFHPLIARRKTASSL